MKKSPNFFTEKWGYNITTLNKIFLICWSLEQSTILYDRRITATLFSFSSEETNLILKNIVKDTILGKSFNLNIVTFFHKYATSHTCLYLVGNKSA